MADCRLTEEMAPPILVGAGQREPRMATLTKEGNVGGPIALVLTKKGVEVAPTITVSRSLRE